MPTVDLRTWDGYAIYRAIQGKAIPTHRVWDNARVMGWQGGNYNKSQYFEATIFDEAAIFDEQNDSFATQLTQHGEVSKSKDTNERTYVVAKSDGSLGTSGALLGMFTGGAKPAFFRVEFNALLKSLGIEPKSTADDLYWNTKVAVQAVRTLLTTTAVDADHYYSKTEDASPHWQLINTWLEGDLPGTTQEDIDSLPRLLAEHAKRAFNFSSEQVALIDGSSPYSEYLGNKNWFALMFQHCLSPRAGNIARETKRLEDSTRPEREEESTPKEIVSGITSEEMLSLQEIAQNKYPSEFYIRLGTAAQELGLPTPFTKDEATEIAKTCKNLKESEWVNRDEFPGIDDLIDVLYDLAIMTQLPFIDVCRGAKSVGWTATTATTVQDQLARRLTGSGTLREIQCDYADRMFHERLSTAQKALFKVNSINQISQILGCSDAYVQSAAASLRANPPYSLTEANLISFQICGKPIKIAFLEKAQDVDMSTEQDEEVGPSFSYDNICDICDITGKTFTEVATAAKALGCRAPFTLVMADRLANYLCGTPSIKAVHKARSKARSRGLESAAGISESGTKSQAESRQDSINRLALQKETQSERSTSLAASPIKTNEGNAALEKELGKDYRRVPIFTPSKAEIPEGYKPSGDEKNDLCFALKNPDQGMRSFFNDLPLLNNDSWIESTLFVPAFNESLYSQLVMEFHRYSMTQLRDQKSAVLKDAERKGAGVGALLGFITGGGLMAPFMAMMGANLNKMTANNVDPSKPIEEYLPDPRLLFLRDEGSYSALREAYQSTSIKRRVCLRKIQKDDGNIYWDVFPMILLDRQAIPAQVFKWDKNYFLRPITAGLVEADIGRLGYNPFKMRRSLSYHPAHDIITPAEFSATSIVGPTIERQPVIFKTGLREDRSFPHYYFDYPKEAQVF